MKKTVIMMVTNGAGLGHLTRGLAVAKRLREIDPEIECVFFSTSLATEVIRNEGFMYYYIPTKSLMPSAVTASLWNEYMKKQLQQILDIYTPQAIIFDGAHPYGGVLSGMRQNSDITSIWIKREGYKPNVSRLEQIEQYFDLVIVPMEAGEGDSLYDRQTDKKKYCKPIVLLNEEEAHDRESVRNTLGINEQNNLFYVQLGAGNINDIHDIYNIVIKCILNNPSNVILLGESIIGKEVGIEDSRVITIRSYPNAQYFRGIDFAVSAVGYNTFHELMYFEVPSLFIPNTKTLKDDQVRRAKSMQEKGAALCLEDITEEKINQALGYMLSYQHIMKEQLSRMHKENGAIEAAQYIIDHIKFVS